MGINSSSQILVYRRLLDLENWLIAGGMDASFSTSAFFGLYRFSKYLKSAPLWISVRRIKYFRFAGHVSVRCKGNCLYKPTHAPAITSGALVPVCHRLRQFYGPRYVIEHRFQASKVRKTQKKNSRGQRRMLKHRLVIIGVFIFVCAWLWCYPVGTIIRN